MWDGDVEKLSWRIGRTIKISQPTFRTHIVLLSLQKESSKGISVHLAGSSYLFAFQNQETKDINDFYFLKFLSYYYLQHFLSKVLTYSHQYICPQSDRLQ